MKLAWLLRGSGWRKWHVHRCLECGRKFSDDEPGSWADNRSDEFPELCRCERRQLRRGLGHADCRAWGPYCPGCATQIQEYWLWQREQYRDLGARPVQPAVVTGPARSHWSPEAAQMA